MADFDEQTYQIGTVARLTGVPAATLRMWERRYGLVEPLRGNRGKRLYTQADIHRLTLLRKLTDRGHAIGGIARLDTEQLQGRFEMADHAASEPLETVSGHCRLLAYGVRLSVILGQLPLPESIEIVGTSRTLVELETTAARTKPDVIMLEYPSLNPDSAAEISNIVRRVGANRAVVVYEFASRDALQTLSRHNIYALRAPLSAETLAGACTGRVDVHQPQAPSDAATVVERRYDDEVLASLAAQSTTVKCECPQHLADLLFRLNAFESYSAECENRNTEDAALHRFLHDQTTQARALLESALARVIEVEGFTLPEVDTGR